MLFRMRGTHYYVFSRLLALSVLCAVAAPAFGQGKIAGRVTDSGTGEGLIGVNVLLEGTQQGAVTDLDGNYVIVNVRPGDYTVLFSYIGFQAQRIEGVRVSTGQTTRYDLSMSEQIIEGQEIIVQAERPLIQRDLTASKKTIVAEEIDALPVEDFLAVLSTQAGVNQGPDGALHIRGGRSDEVSYLVDGMSVSNPFFTNGLGAEISNDAIQEMTVISGAFNAEYGRAMSGIVNLVTKEGGSRFHGSLGYWSGDNVTGHRDIFLNPSGFSPMHTYTIEGNLSGPLPFFKKLTLFGTVRHDSDDGTIYGVREHLPSDSANFNLPRSEADLNINRGGLSWYYEMYDPDLGRSRPVSEFDEGATPDFEAVPMNPSKSTRIFGKAAIRPGQGMKLEYSYIYDKGERTPFVFAYRYNPDGVASIYDRTHNHSVHWTHTLNQRAFYTLRASYQDLQRNEYLYPLIQGADACLDAGTPLFQTDPGNNPDAGFCADPRYVSTRAIIGFQGNHFLFGGDQKQQDYRDATTVRGKFDLTRQFGTTHEVKLGAEVEVNELDRQSFDVLFDGDQYRQPTIAPVSTPVHDVYSDQRFSQYFAYVQDKMEFSNFIVNAGLRFELYDPEGYYFPDATDPAIIRPGESIDDALASGVLLPSETKSLFLPRLGVSFPLTSTGIVHFSYGHFAQMPTPLSMYVNSQFEFGVNTEPSYGNTNIRPERTVQYELGLQQQLTNDLAFDITTFFKDIRDYPVQQQIQFSTVSGQNVYNMLINKDFANVKGIAFALTKRRSPNGILSADLNYTFQLAEGGETDADEVFFNALADRESGVLFVPLMWDQRHFITATVTLSKPNNWSASFIGTYNTGYPYTPELIDQKIDQEPRAGRKPTQYNVDANLYKIFNVGGSSLRLFVRIFNLLDHINELYVFDETGRASYSLSEQLNLNAFWEPNYGQLGIHDLSDYDTRPQYYSRPRQIKFGATITF